MDYDFTAGMSSLLVSYFYPPYRLLKRMNPKIAEWFVSRPSNNVVLNFLEYLAIKTVLRFPMLDEHQIPLLDISSLKTYCENTRTTIGLFSRRPTEQLKRISQKAGYLEVASVAVGSESFQDMANRGYVRRCVMLLDEPAERTLVMSDSPFDLIKAKEIGAKTCGVPVFYLRESLEALKPDFGVRTAQETVESLYQTYV